MKNTASSRRVGMAILAAVIAGAGWQMQRAQAQFGGGYSGPARAEDVASTVASLNQRVDALSTVNVPASLTTDNIYLYMVRGNTLYKFTKAELTLVKRVELEPTSTPAAGNRGGFPSGGYSGPPFGGVNSGGGGCGGVPSGGGGFGGGGFGGDGTGGGFGKGAIGNGIGF